MRECKVEGCTRPAAQLGWCSAHYHRLRRTGTLSADKPIGSIGGGPGPGDQSGNPWKGQHPCPACDAGARWTLPYVPDQAPAHIYPQLRGRWTCVACGHDFAPALTAVK